MTGKRKKDKLKQDKHQKHQKQAHEKKLKEKELGKIHGGVAGSNDIFFNEKLDQKSKQIH
jgi:hypothetical protein